jgi:hypothetical protein
MRIDSARLESWARLLSGVSLLAQESRKTMGRLRFSDAEELALDHDQSERSATEAAVRPLTPEETLEWRAQGQHSAEQRTTTDPAAEHGLRVRVGPCRTDGGPWMPTSTASPPTVTQSVTRWPA